ncbi:MAG: alpha-amylase family glycosyl hydrolase [Caldilineaceae bacterium]
MDYIADLGVTALWLSPFFKTSFYHGYDTVDFYTVDPRFGTNDDVRALVDAAHARGLRVILDFVANHVGTGFAPFAAAAADPADPHRAWFSFGPEYKHGYRSFFDVAAMPQLDTDHPDAPLSPGPRPSSGCASMTWTATGWTTPQGRPPLLEPLPRRLPRRQTGLLALRRGDPQARSCAPTRAGWTAAWTSPSAAACANSAPGPRPRSRWPNSPTPSSAAAVTSANRTNSSCPRSSTTTT